MRRRERDGVNWPLFSLMLFIGGCTLIGGLFGEAVFGAHTPGAVLACGVGALTGVAAFFALKPEGP